MTMEMDLDGTKCEGGGESSPGCSGYSSMVHSKKVIKHALRQQAKRRRKNTTIAAGNSRTLPRIVVKPLPPPPPDDIPLNVANVPRTPTTEEPAATMREVLASLPGFSLKSSRRKSTKRLSAAAQLEAGLVDLESPASILASTSLRALLNRYTFQGLPPLYQRKLAQLLPAVDRQDAATSGLNNEFFARACLEWKKRLAEGEFTPENQQRLKMEAERDKNKLDPWKLKHFEPIWGEKREPKLRSGPHSAVEPRPIGAVTRSSLRLRSESIHDQTAPDLVPCSAAVTEEKVAIASYVSKGHIMASSLTTESQAVSLKSTQECEDDKEMVPSNSCKEVLTQQKLNSSNVIIKSDPDPFIEETPVIVTNDETTKSSELRVSETPGELMLEIANGVAAEIINEEIHKSEEPVSDVPDEEISRQSDNHDSEICKIESNVTTENLSSCDGAPLSEPISENQSIINSQPEVEESTTTTTVDGEPQIPEEMEIDSETLQRIHELEVRGEMIEAYEEISGCPENIYPILADIEIGSSTGGGDDNPVVPVQGPVNAASCEMTTGNEEDAFIDANNYVLESREISTGMLECNWTVEPTVNNVGVTSTHEELQVPWPLVTAALDGSVAANITVTTQDDCNDSSTSNEIESIPKQNNTKTSIAEVMNSVQIPVDQSPSYERADTLTVGTPVTSCLLNNIQSNSPPIIAFPPLQSIRFVQTNFHTGQTNSNSVPIQIQNQSNPSPQLSVVSTQEETIVQISSANVVGQTNVATSNVLPRNQAQSNPICVPSPNQGRGQSTIVVQQQTPIVAQPRQIVTATVQQQYATSVVTAPSRLARSTSQGGPRGSRSGNKEQGGGRSRSSTKEPPGAVNLERSYQICQAVIQSSPNRDQLKAHLKPPPSLLARADGTFTTSKPGGRTLTSVKTQKAQQAVQHVKHTQNKGQAVMLRHVFATTRQAIPAEVTESGAVAQLGPNGTNGLGQYILVQRTGVGDSAPRASSAPPLPPQIAGMGVGLHLVRGRPASAGEGSHQAVTLKARGASDGRGGGGAEPGAPGVIMGGDPPPPCECNMRGAMVICRQCGAFCHDDCIGPQRICATCLIR
ncbi:polycomb protein Asx isoform X1 [Neodiprion lecontei]|uniref:Polycomb protein Asx isoform X1 n=1 Tax=Neodiprion lecontei TaxID=441921 RepID=A0A6J0BR64_NEOLC|nr:polycomb protein Asx isoform X1 [Neodiprion lecontei]XP_046587998.1 polycomb protein Asx isoform X1 [Neodiprion lecontei]XP_046587999.1 polycomb protein Asx isoform X1 [Neodiprion lecontei]